MKKIYFTLTALLVLAACNKKESTETAVTDTADTAVAAPAPADSANVSTSQNVSVPAAAPQNINVTPQVVTSQQNVSVVPTAPGMNPPHGQPNHRCEIPVGAPLSTPVQNAAPQTSVLPQTVAPAPTQALNPMPQPSAAPVATAPGMNPPHGEPGHRCDIPVGAPLNSK